MPSAFLPLFVGRGRVILALAPDCRAVTGDGGTAEWAELPPGSGYVVAEQDAGPEWVEPPAQGGLSVGPAARVEVVVVNRYEPAARLLYLPMTAAMND